MNTLSKFAYDPNDSDEGRLNKAAIFLVSGSCVVAGCIWTLMYFSVFGLGLTAFLPLLFVVIVSSSLLVSHISRDIRYAIYAQIGCIIYITFFVQWSIGGIFDSGFVLAWALCGPVVALIYLPIRRAAVWFGLYGVNILITVIFDGYFSASGLGVDDTTQRIFVLLNILTSSLVIFGFAGYFVNKAVVAERTLTGAVDAMAEGFAYFDKDDRLKIFNSKFADLTKVGTELKTGVHYEDMMRQRAGFGFANDTEFELEEYIEERMRRHRDPEGQHTTSFADGMWLLVNESRTKEGGSVTALTDISELKRVENELAEKEEQLRAVLDNMPGGVRYVDKDRNYVFFNSQYSDIYDFPKDLLKVGDSHRVENIYQANRGDFGAGDPEKLVDEWLSSLPLQIKPLQWERPMYDGRILDARTQPLSDGSYVNFVTDITERKNIEEALSKTRNALEIAHRQANDLLLNAIPETIAERLKDNPDQLIADRHNDVSIMFIDVAGFTAMSAEQRPEETVNMLNELFSDFDDVVETAGVEKIRTIGDGYMVVGGAPLPLEDHVAKTIKVAQSILKIAQQHSIDVRIGINAGEVVAGIIGTRRFHYDVWGDAVNIAARLETTGEVGKIHICESVADRLPEGYLLEKRETIKMKGKGRMQTWFVEPAFG